MRVKRRLSVAKAARAAELERRGGIQGSRRVIAAASTLQIALIVLLVAGIERGGMGRLIRSR